MEQIDQACNRFEEALRTGANPVIEDYLREFSHLQRAVLLPELLAVELHFRRKRGDDEVEAEYQRRFPDDTGLVNNVFRDCGKPSGIEGRSGYHEKRHSPHEAAAFGGRRTTAQELTAEQREGPGAQIGPYKLREQIGEGGSGWFSWPSRRTRFDRRVALKVIKPGMDSREVIAVSRRNGRPWL